MVNDDINFLHRGRALLLALAPPLARRALLPKELGAALGELHVDQDRDGEQPVEDVAQDRADCIYLCECRMPKEKGALSVSELYIEAC